MGTNQCALCRLLASTLTFLSMDFVQLVVSKVPVPYLSAAFELLGYIYRSVQEVRTSKKQLVILIHVAAGFLEALNGRYLAGKHAYSEPSTLLGDLERCVLSSLRGP